MPSDITGSEILDEDRHFRFVKGPVFANIVLADEINRTPPKTQAALLESMQEYAVTIAGMRYELPRPFFVQIGRHTSELQSLMRISYAVFCLKKKKNQQTEKQTTRY